VNDHTDVDIQVGGKLAKSAGDLILELKFLDSRRLLGKHELHVINADELDVVGIDSVVECLEHQVNRGGPVEVHEIQGMLFELFY
jgi:hypothetical protein